MKIMFNSDFVGGSVEKIVITQTENGSVMKCYQEGFKDGDDPIHINLFDCLFDVVVEDEFMKP